MIVCFYYSPKVDDEPIYEKPPLKYSAETVLKILLDDSIPPTKICQKRPLKIVKSSTYVVDISKLRHPDDVKKDNFGIWSHSGSHPQFFKIFNESDGTISVEKCAPGASGANVVQLRRLHSVHPLNNQFKRMIAFVTGN